MPASLLTRHRSSRRWLRAILVIFLAGSASAQPGWRDPARPALREDEGYDGRFTFVRLRWDGRHAYGRHGIGNAWNHEYPRAEPNLMRVLQDLTLIDANTDGSLILGLDDPELFKHPIALMWEPGFWTMTDHQGEAFREYLLKGGFVIFDDFEADQWDNFEAQMRACFPTHDGSS